MSYRIYADRVWIMHTCINVLLLFLTAKLSGMTVRVRRIIEIAAGNALCFTAILLLPAPAVLQGEVGIILAGKTFFLPDCSTLVGTAMLSGQKPGRNAACLDLLYVLCLRARRRLQRHF